MQEPDGGEFTQVKWSNDESHILWSSCDQKVSMWNVAEQKEVFVHSGSRGPVNQIDTCHNEPDTVAVVDNSNEIQVFQPNQNCKV